MSERRLALETGRERVPRRRLPEAVDLGALYDGLVRSAVTW